MSAVDPCEIEHPDAGCADVGCTHNCEAWAEGVERIRVMVTVDTDELREWAGRHADAGHHGVAHVLYQAAKDGESLTEQHDAEVRRAVGWSIGRAVPDDCYMMRSAEVSCTSLIGSSFANGAPWTEEMCCLPCRVRARIAEVTQ